MLLVAGQLEPKSPTMPPAYCHAESSWKVRCLNKMLNTLHGCQLASLFSCQSCSFSVALVVVVAIRCCWSFWCHLMAGAFSAFETLNHWCQRPFLAHASECQSVRVCMCHTNQLETDFQKKVSMTYLPVLACTCLLATCPFQHQVHQLHPSFAIMSLGRETQMPFRKTKGE